MGTLTRSRKTNANANAVEWDGSWIQGGVGLLLFWWTEASPGWGAAIKKNNVRVFFLLKLAFWGILVDESVVVSDLTSAKRKPDQPVSLNTSKKWMYPYLQDRYRYPGPCTTWSLLWRVYRGTATARYWLPVYRLYCNCDKKLADTFTQSLFRGIALCHLSAAGGAKPDESFYPRW